MSNIRDRQEWRNLRSDVGAYRWDAYVWQRVVLYLFIFYTWSVINKLFLLII